MNEQEMRKKLDELCLGLSESKYECLVTLLKLAEGRGQLSGIKQAKEILGLKG